MNRDLKDAIYQSINKVRCPNCGKKIGRLNNIVNFNNYLIREEVECYGCNYKIKLKVTVDFDVK